MAETGEQKDDGFYSYVGSLLASKASKKNTDSEKKDEGKSVGFARDIGERVNQGLNINTATGDKFFGSGANPNLIQNSSFAWVAIVAVAILIALYLYLRLR